MDIKIIPSKLRGSVSIPASKSIVHRALISAALADGVSVISNVTFSQDIYATIDALKAIGAEIEVSGNTVTVKGLSENTPETADINCAESGSTLRFLIPVTSALGISAVYSGRGRLPERPITPYIRELSEKGIHFDYNNTMPFTVSGKLRSGIFKLEGNVSSQFVTGLLFALPLLENDSEIVLTSRLESKPYADMTISCLDKFGVKISETGNGYYIKGGQKYKPVSLTAEGDYSQAAFFEAANALGSDIKIAGLNEKSYQGDKKIIEICREIVYNNSTDLKPFRIDCSDIPDLVPILAVLGTFCKGRSYITNAARLRIKECDRLAAMAYNLNEIGGRITELTDGLVIDGVDSLDGGTIDGFNDHRIAMATAIASTRCANPLIITGAECVSKSYPDFWEDFRALGGIFEVI